MSLFAAFLGRACRTMQRASCTALLILMAAGHLSGQTPGDEARLFPSRERTFRIPFSPQANDQRLREVHLLYSTDEGRNWRFHGSALPGQGFFEFTAAADGMYWFAVRTIDQQGRTYPLRDSELRAGIKVLVDTQPPRVILRALPAQGTSVGVQWDVSDEHIDLATLRLEYLPAGGGQHLPLRADPVAVGQHTWVPLTGGPLEVRLTVSDTAGNVGQDKVIVSAAGGFAPPPPIAGGTAPSPISPGPPPIRMVNSKIISLNYRIDDEGPSGISAIELWYTSDGRNWQKYKEQRAENNTPIRPPFVFEVQSEGLYGFTLLARSGVGLSERTPQPGDVPQVWVEVDETRPVVRLLGAEVGRGADTGKLTITWSAADKNLTPQPINLSYSEKPEGEWTTIAASLPNTGRFVWAMPPNGIPYRFHVRVEGIDKAGNVGSAQTSNPVIVDLHKPRPLILDVGAAGR